MQITLLGGFEVVVDGRRVPPADWRRRQAAALVKLLALAPRRTLHREQVIDALWPDLYLDEAAPRLHKAAHYARRAIGQPRSLVLGGDTVTLFPDAEVDIDAVRFERLAESARDSRTAGQAVDAYPGDLLPQDLYETWAEEPRERLRLLYLRTLRQAGRWQEIVNIGSIEESAHLDTIRGPVGASDLTRRDRGQIVIVGGSAAGLRQPTVRSDGDRPYERVLEAVGELCRNHLKLPAGATPIAVVIM